MDRFIAIVVEKTTGENPQVRAFYGASKDGVRSYLIGQTNYKPIGVWAECEDMYSCFDFDRIVGMSGVCSV